MLRKVPSSAKREASLGLLGIEKGYLGAHYRAYWVLRKVQFCYLGAHYRAYWVLRKVQFFADSAKRYLVLLSLQGLLGIEKGTVQFADSAKRYLVLLSWGTLQGLLGIEKGTVPIELVC